jgi:hypothetical protein
LAPFPEAARRPPVTDVLMLALLAAAVAAAVGYIRVCDYLTRARE